MKTVVPSFAAHKRSAVGAVRKAYSAVWSWHVGLYLLCLYSSAAQSQTAQNHYWRHMPPVFVENKGQWNSQARFVAQTSEMNVWLTNTGLVYDVYRQEGSGVRVVHGQVIRATFVAAPNNQNIRQSNFTHVRGLNKQRGVHHYVQGNNAARWYTNVPLWGEVRMDYLAEGISARVYIDSTTQTPNAVHAIPQVPPALRIRYDIIVQPGTNPHTLAIELDGADTAFVNAQGELVMQTALGEFRNGKIFAYQIRNGTAVEIPCRFDAIRASRAAPAEPPRFGFALGAYDPRLPLIIDPLLYSTHIGGAGLDQATAIALDANGSSYVSGLSFSMNFPTSTGAYKRTLTGSADGFVAKLSSAGDELVYSTYIGGTMRDEISALTVQNGAVYCAGQTSSPDFPTLQAAQPVFGGTTDAVVVRLGANGIPTYSTFIGGSEEDAARAIAVNSSGEAFVAGYTKTNNLNTSPDALQRDFGGNTDAFVARLTANGSTLQFLTYLGGSATDEANAIAVDAAGVYVAGLTVSSNFQTSTGALQRSHRGGGDVFVAKLNLSGTDRLYATYLGGDDAEEARALAVDATGAVIVAGRTGSRNFPTRNGAFSTHQGDFDVFVSKLNPTATALVYSTLLGGTARDEANAMVLGNDGTAYIAGETRSMNFFTRLEADQRTFGGGASDGFLAKITPDGGSVIYSSFLGGSGNDAATGIAIDGRGEVYVCGRTASSDFPVSSSAYQRRPAGFDDAFVAKVRLPEAAPPPFISELIPPRAFAGEGSISLTIRGRGFVQPVQVRFGESMLSPERVSSTEIVAPVPGALINAAGEYLVSVTNPDGQRASRAFIVETLITPNITSLQPSSALAGLPGDIVVVITGMNFADNVQVFFDGTAIPILQRSNTQLNVSIPAQLLLLPGDRIITVRNGDGRQSQASFFVRLSAVPTITLLPAIPLDFGIIAPSQISTARMYVVSGANLMADVSLTASANVQLSLDGTTWTNALTLRRPAISPNTLPATTVLVRVLAPAQPTTVSGSITHTSTGAAQVTLSVTAVVSNSATVLPVRFEPVLANFGAVRLGRDSTIHARLTNLGTRSGRFTATITGTEAADFTLLDALQNAELMPNESRTLRIRFTPTANGARSGMLLLTGDGTASLPLSGTGTAPVLRASTSAIDFGAVFIGQQRPVTQTLQITNVGTAAGRVETPVFMPSGDFLAVNFVPRVLQIGETVPLTVQFRPRPSERGEFTPLREATMSMMAEGANTPNTIAVRLTGTARELPPPVLVSPESIARTSTTPRLQWTRVAEASQYEVQVAQEATFSAASVVFRNSNISSDITALPVTLEEGKVYSWRVRSKRALVGGDSVIGAWSNVAAFTTPSRVGFPQLQIEPALSPAYRAPGNIHFGRVPLEAGTITSSIGIVATGGAVRLRANAPVVLEHPEDGEPNTAFSIEPSDREALQQRGNIATTTPELLRVAFTPPTRGRFTDVQLRVYPAEQGIAPFALNLSGEGVLCLSPAQCPQTTVDLEVLTPRSPAKPGDSVRVRVWLRESARLDIPANDATVRRLRVALLLKNSSMFHFRDNRVFDASGRVANTDSVTNRPLSGGGRRIEFYVNRAPGQYRAVMLGEIRGIATLGRLDGVSTGMIEFATRPQWVDNQGNLIESSQVLVSVGRPVPLRVCLCEQASTAVQESPNQDEVPSALQPALQSMTQYVPQAHSAEIFALTPNPSSEAAELVYAIRTPCYAEVLLVDMLGRVVKTLTSKHHEQGVFALPLPANEIAAGLYRVVVKTPFDRISSAMEVVR